MLHGFCLICYFFSLPWKGECIIDLHLETSHKPRMELGQHEGAMSMLCLVENYSEHRVSFALTQFKFEYIS